MLNTLSDFICKVRKKLLFNSKIKANDLKWRFEYLSVQDFFTEGRLHWVLHNLLLFIEDMIFVCVENKIPFYHGMCL